MQRIANADTIKENYILKTLKELTLLDKFLFDEVMDIPEAHEAALRIILGDENLRSTERPENRFTSSEPILSECDGFVTSETWG